MLKVNVVYNISDDLNSEAFIGIDKASGQFGAHFQSIW